MLKIKSTEIASLDYVIIGKISPYPIVEKEMITK